MNFCMQTTTRKIHKAQTLNIHEMKNSTQPPELCQSVASQQDHRVGFLLQVLHSATGYSDFN